MRMRMRLWNINIVSTNFCFHPTVRNQFQKEHCHNDNKTNPKCHWIDVERMPQTRVPQAIASGAEQVDKGRCYNDPGTKIFGDEETPRRHFDKGVFRGQHWEEGSQA